MAGHYKAMYESLKNRRLEEIEQAVKQERDSWINQPANDHDNRIREARDKQILDAILNTRYKVGYQKQGVRGRAVDTFIWHLKDKMKVNK